VHRACAVAIITGMTRGAEARLFVALDLPVELRGRLLGWARTAAASVRDGNPAHPAGSAATRAPSAMVYRGVVRSPGRRREARPLPTRQLRLLDPDFLHVTLCFLGNRPVGEIEALDEALGAACAEAPPVGELSFGAPLWLPPRHPRALAVELHDTPDRALEALHGALAAVCDLEPAAAPGLGPSRAIEGRRRRFRPHVTVARMRPSEAPRERALPPTPALSFTPRSVTLQRSWLTPTEAVYEGLFTYALADI
jgi:RNA 2',3'-cyclic 3'-phosphodiesterase